LYSLKRLSPRALYQYLHRYQAAILITNLQFTHNPLFPPADEHSNSALKKGLSTAVRSSCVRKRKNRSSGDLGEEEEGDEAQGEEEEGEGVEERERESQRDFLECSAFDNIESAVSD
jgi:hypothetical protein